jgi:hypothetical protein
MITSALPEVKSTIQMIRDHIKDRRAPIVIGGNCIDRHLLEYANPDYWAQDAVQGIRICRKVLNSESDNSLNLS